MGGNGVDLELFGLFGRSGRRASSPVNDVKETLQGVDKSYGDQSIS